MTVNLTPRAVELLEDQLARGAGRSPEEVIERALETFAERTEGTATLALGRPIKTAAEAVADIQELRKGVTLGGVKIKDLIHAGHKY